MAALATTRWGAGQPAPKSSVRRVASAASSRSLVAGMGAALVGEQEAGAGDGAPRAGLERPGTSAALGDPAGEQQREAGGSAARTRSSSSRAGVVAAHVAARLDALDDHAVGAGGLGGARLLDGAALVDPGAAGAALRRPPEGDDDVGRPRGLEPVRRANGSSRLTASGRPSAPRGASSRSIASAPTTAIVPSPPASETAAASSWRLIPPPIPAWTTGSRCRGSRGSSPGDLRTRAQLASSSPSQTMTSETIRIAAWNRCRRGRRRCSRLRTTTRPTSASFS